MVSSPAMDTGTVATGEETITLVEERQPGLILMDIALTGELNGIETAEVIRSFSDVPIVFLTGYSLESPYGNGEEDVKMREMMKITFGTMSDTL
jgi:CheY-like chemotaxis protein